MVCLMAGHSSQEISRGAKGLILFPDVFFRWIGTHSEDPLRTKPLPSSPGTG